MFKLLGNYVFRHHSVFLRMFPFIILPNYISTIAALVKINKILKTLKLSNVIKWLILHEVCKVMNASSLMMSRLVSKHVEA